MTDERLPFFRFHPDPLATGSVVRSTETCARCGVARGFIYDGTAFSRGEMGLVCPWCIADGSAAQGFDVDFTYLNEPPGAVPDPSLDELLHRTPGFIGWQQAQWMIHCGEVAAFLGRAGWDDVQALPGAADCIRAEGWPEEDQLPYLHADGNMTAYLFRCLHCGTGLAYVDMS